MRISRIFLRSRGPLEVFATIQNELCETQGEWEAELMKWPEIFFLRFNTLFDISMPYAGIIFSDDMNRGVLHHVHCFHRVLHRVQSSCRVLHRVHCFHRVQSLCRVLHRVHPVYCRGDHDDHHVQRKPKPTWRRGRKVQTEIEMRKMFDLFCHRFKPQMNKSVVPCRLLTKNLMLDLFLQLLFLFVINGCSLRRGNRMTTLRRWVSLYTIRKSISPTFLSVNTRLFICSLCMLDDDRFVSRLFYPMRINQKWETPKTRMTTTTTTTISNKLALFIRIWVAHQLYHVISTFDHCNRNFKSCLDSCNIRIDVVWLWAI